MEPMNPMAPMREMQAWWPDSLGQPSSTGSQNGARYAFFPNSSRLLIDSDGTLTTYHTGDHMISGVSQGSRGKMEFQSQLGILKLEDLKSG